MQAVREAEHLLHVLTDKGSGGSTMSKYSPEDHRVFLVEADQQFGLGLVLYFETKSLALCRMVNLKRLYNKGEDVLTISKGSLLHFQNMGHLVESLKYLLDGTIFAFSRRMIYAPVVFFTFHRLCHINPEEFQGLCRQKKVLLDKTYQWYAQSLDYLYEQDREEILKQQRRLSTTV